MLVVAPTLQLLYAQELREGDPDRRQEISENMMKLTDTNIILLENVFFSDESTFTSIPFK